MDPFIGEIRLMGGNFAPKGWAQCNGQLLPVAQNQALYALLGTSYGGNGQTSFGLPDLRGRTPIGFDPSAHPMGQTGGSEGVALTSNQMPAHTHALTGSIKVADSVTGASPSTSYPAASSVSQYGTGTPNANMSGASLIGSTGNTGNSQPHENRQPVLALNYCIALVGIFPSRS